MEEAKQLPEQESLFDDIDLSSFVAAKDELNLAEFPISAVSTRIAPGQKTIVYEDSIYDRENAALIPRRLTIKASDKCGLPTAIDDEILLGLIQLTKIRGFRERTVKFSRYELLKLLGWKDHSRNYKRLEESLERWHDVSLHYENAWRDRTKNAWVTEHFHILERVSLWKPDQPGGYDSSEFQWSEVIFENFKAGSLKSLDFHLFKKLKSHIAKRMFRFLDKRFFHRNAVSYDLEAFALEKVGMSRSYGIGEIKRRLTPAIKELEDAKFIRRVPKESRYQKVGRGKWNICFHKFNLADENQEPLAIKVDDLSALEAKLVKHGVTKSQAQRLIAKHPEEMVEAKVELLEFKISKGDAPENAGGFLVKAVEEDYANPRGFKTQAELQLEATDDEKRRKEREAKMKAKAEAEARMQSDKDEAHAKQEKLVADYLASLSEADREQLKAEALKRSGSLASVVQEQSPLRAAIIHNHVLDLLAQKKPQASR